MNWTMKDNVESVMRVSTVELKNCTKDMVVEYHNKTIYDCRNVTKRHCTTLWTVNERGEKIWAGNEDDCRDVTWEECSPVIKTVPMAVAQMVCDSVPVNYFDYENTTNPRMADSLDCTVDKRVVCSPVTSSKCAEITYTKCEEVSPALSLSLIMSCILMTNSPPTILDSNYKLFRGLHSSSLSREAAEAVVSV